MATPQVIVTLSPQGDLIAELPGLNGSRRQVPLRTNEETVESCLLRILNAQVKQQTSLGQDGAPTAAQVKHWERHDIFSDPSCPFCKAEGRFPTGKNRERAIKGMKPADAIRLGLEARGYKPSNSTKSPNLWTKANNPHIYFHLTPHGTPKVQDQNKIEFSQEKKQSLILDGKEHARKINWEPAPLTPAQLARQKRVVLKRDGVTVIALGVKKVKSEGKAHSKGKGKINPQQLEQLQAELEY